MKQSEIMQRILADTRKRRVCVLICGLPGSSKSYFASWLEGELSFAHANQITTVHLNADQHCYEGERYRYDLIPAAWAQVRMRFGHALTSPRTRAIILDAVFAMRMSRDAFLDVAHGAGYSCHIVYVSNTAAQSINEQRSPDRQVPAEKWEDFQRKFQIPASTEAAHVYQLEVFHR